MWTFLCLLTLLDGPSYTQEIRDEDVFLQISLENHGRPDILRGTKYMAPASADESLLETVYQNVNVYPFHLEFLTTEFPERFAGLTLAEYTDLIERRGTRQYFAGSLYQLQSVSGEVFYGFDLYTDPASRAELPFVQEVEWIHARISETCSLRPLVYAPSQAAAQSQAREWEGTPFQIYLPDVGIFGDYKAYLTGTAYGRMRVFELDDLLAASEAGELSWQDIVVVDQAPGDLVSPVSGVITGTPQTDLSHLSLRLNQRGTPSAFVAEGNDSMRPYRDTLVRMEVRLETVRVTVVEDPQEAEDWWQAHRPRLPLLPTFDLSVVETQSLDDMALDPEATSKYGAKARNMALLKAALPEEHAVTGFGIPFAWYERFMEENEIPHPFEPGWVSYSGYLRALESDDEFRTDPVRRTTLLNRLIAYAEANAAVPREYVIAAADEMVTIFGSTRTKLRFRSSSNFEDIVPFNGAGLYESTSVCAADSLDIDSSGPSRCDASDSSERTLEEGFVEVWTSLWSPKAYNERDYWQASQDRAKMGILVTPAFLDEEANGVVVTGSPSVPGDNRYIVNVQAGEVDVVDPPVGVLPEKLLLDVDDGVVHEITRVRPSSLMPPGEWILSDAEATRIGELVWLAAQELAPHFSSGLGEVLLDMEFKVLPSGGEPERRVVFKQARPFLRGMPSEAELLALIVPEGARACGLYTEERSLAEEYSLLSSATLVSGRLSLPARSGTLDGDLFEAIVVGPDGLEAIPDGPGRFTCTSLEREADTLYLYTFRQVFTVDGEPLEVEADNILFRVDHEGGGRREIILDEDFLSYDLDLRGQLGAGPGRDEIYFASCTCEALPLFHTEVTATSGERAQLTIRHEPPDILTGPECLTGASIDLGDANRVQTDYWRLVATAAHHNKNREYWVFLDPPVGDAHVVELREETYEPLGEPDPPQFRLLDAGFRVIQELTVESWDMQRVQDTSRPEFVRGDADASGSVNLTDAIRILSVLFQGGARLACEDASDANDDGNVNISDAVRVLLYLFSAGPELPWPTSEECGKDRTEDELPDCSYDVSSCPER